MDTYTVVEFEALLHYSRNALGLISRVNLSKPVCVPVWVSSGFGPALQRHVD